MSRHLEGWIAAVVISASTLACAGGLTRIGKVFDTSWQDDSGRSIDAVRKRLAGYQMVTGTNVALGVVPDGLIGLPLDGGAKWKFSHALDARPYIAGQVVVGTGEGLVFALDAATGRKLWERASGGRLRGAGDDGRTTIVSLAPTVGRGAVLLAVDRDGNVIRQLDVDVAAGQPGVMANLAFIPWQNQYVTVYDLASGDEVARVTLRHQTSRVLTVNGTMYFGELGLTRFDDRIGFASRDQASFVDLPSRELPGSPRWLRQGGVERPPASDATDRIRIVARPADHGGKLGVDSDRYYATYYHAVLGFRASSAELAWVRQIEQDAIAAGPFTGGVAVCDEKGGVHFFDAAHGGDTGEMSFGSPIQSCVMQADTLTRPKAKEAATPLVQQIADAIRTKETEMVMMQRFLVRELANQKDPLATRKLIELAIDPRTSPVLIPEVREALSARHDGVDHMMKALETRYDFLHDQKTLPPSGPIAFALASIGEKSAAPVLVEHLLDPMTSADDAKHIALALHKLAGPEQAGKLQGFAAIYRCTAVDDDLVQAVLAVARTLVRLDFKNRALIASWAADPMTSVLLKEPFASIAGGPAVPAASKPQP